MKKLQNLKGVKALNKIEQQAINGGSGPIYSESECMQVCGYWLAEYILCIHPTNGCA